MDAKTRRYVDSVLVAADDFDAEALDRAYERAMAEAAKHREREAIHRQAAEEGELLARRLAGISQLRRADSAEPSGPVPPGHASGSGRVPNEAENQAHLVRAAVASRAAGEIFRPKGIFEQLVAQGADVSLSNVQLEMGRMMKRGELIRGMRGEYQRPVGGE
jgi:hypothetical protein